MGPHRNGTEKKMHLPVNDSLCDVEKTEEKKKREVTTELHVANNPSREGKSIATRYRLPPGPKPPLRGPLLGTRNLTGSQ